MDRRKFMIAAGAAGAAGAFGPGLGWAGSGEDPAAREARMAWWREARFGMFIHWGLYAVPAGVWKGRKSRTFPAEWIMYAKSIPKREYAQLASQFNPAEFNAREWAQIAKNAGMKYLVITSKHHDGFAMYHSKISPYNIVDATPFGRDPIAELAEACAGEGVRFGLYYSQLDWSKSVWPPSAYYTPRFNEYMEYMQEQVREILTGYGPICSLFFDGDWIPQWNNGRGREVETLCRELQPDTIINNRLSKRTLADNLATLAQSPSELTLPPVGDYATPEQTIPATPPACDWETCMTMNDSWGYRSWDDNWKSAETLIRNLVDIVSKGGNYLLNVGPDALGLIPGPSVERLAVVGEWMKVNGESICGAGAGPLQQQSWGRTTKKPGKVFLQVFDWPSGPLTVSGLDAPVKKASLLADGAPVSFTASGPNLTLQLPPAAPDPIATVVALEI